MTLALLGNLAGETKGPALARQKTHALILYARLYVNFRQMYSPEFEDSPRVYQLLEEIARLA